MAYEVNTRQKERADERALTLDGITYPPLLQTIGLDRQLQPLRVELDQLIDDANKAHRTAAGLDENLDRVDPQPTAAKFRKLELEALAADEKLLRGKCALIVAGLDKSETGEALTVDVLIEKFAIADVDAYLSLLYNGTETLPDRPTGGSVGV